MTDTDSDKIAEAVAEGVAAGIREAVATPDPQEHARQVLVHAFERSRSKLEDNPFANRISGRNAA